MDICPWIQPSTSNPAWILGLRANSRLRLDMPLASQYAPCSTSRSRLLLPRGIRSPRLREFPAHTPVNIPPNCHYGIRSRNCLGNRIRGRNSGLYSVLNKPTRLAYRPGNSRESIPETKPMIRVNPCGLIRGQLFHARKWTGRTPYAD